MEVESSRTERESQSGESPVGFNELRLEELIAQGRLDFDGWTSLISEIESSFHFQDDIEKICLVYDSFLAEYPLCYGYWRKYADHMRRLCNSDKVVEVFERAVQSATYSIGMWVEYCSFGISAFEDPTDIRRLFKRAMSFVGKDYLCHTLWDKYIAFEFSQQHWSSLAHVYIQTLRFPSKKLHHYFEGLENLASTWKEEIQSSNDSEMEIELKTEIKVPTGYTDDEISCVIEDLVNPSTSLAGMKALQKYLSIGKQMYKEASQLDEKIRCFETEIGRSYFHVKPLNISQLDNWNQYLDFVEMHGDFDWAVKLYERCLIPCANYPEFWMRYVDFMERKGGREIANFALTRATQVFLKRLPVMHLFNARFKEQIRDVSGARDAILQHNIESDSSFLENVTIKANMEKRLGNFEVASNIYKEAVEIAAAKEKLNVLPQLYIQFSQLQYMITDNRDAARDILIDGIKRMPYCKLLLEELVKFGMMHGEARHIHVINSVITDAISLGAELSQCLSAKDAEDISCLYLQFVDLCGTIDDVRKAWNQHIKLFPDSVRTASYKLSAIDIEPLKITTLKRQETFGALPHLPSEDHNSDIPNNVQFQDNVLLSPENDVTQPTQPVTDLVSDQKPSMLENNESLSDQAKVILLDSGDVDKRLQEEMQHISSEVLQQPGEESDDTTNPNLSSLDLVNEVCNEVDTLQTRQEFSKENDVQQQNDQKSEQDLNQLPLERLSLEHQENKSFGSVNAASHEHEPSQETSLSNGSMVKSELPQETSTSNTNMLEIRQNDRDPSVSSPLDAQAFDSAETQIRTDTSSSAGRQSLMTTEQQSLMATEQLTPMHGGRNWHQRNNTDRARREARFGFRGNSHKKLHQKQQISPQPQFPRAEIGAHMPMNQGYPSPSMSSQSSQVQQGSVPQNQYSTAPYANMTAAQAWSMQNMQQQNFASTFQAQLASKPIGSQAQISQHPMQSNEQFGQMQANPAYNQMWQYYYYQQQQQQFLLQQQQLLQLQQQDQQPHLQQLQMQQYYLQQQQQQLTHQQPQPHLQQQQQQPQYSQQEQFQLQQQQQYLLQQQQQHLQQQNHLLYLQQQQQQLQLQQLQHQQPQKQLHQQLPVSQHQEQEQRQKEEQTMTSQIQTGNDFSKQEAIVELGQKTSLDQESTLPHTAGASETVSSTASPHPHQQSS